MIWVGGPPDSGTLGGESESGGICGETLDDNEWRVDICNPLDESKRSGDEDESNVIDGNIGGLTLDDRTLEAAEIVIPWMIWGSPLSDGIDTRNPFEGGKALDDRTLEDEIWEDWTPGAESESDGICVETLDDNERRYDDHEKSLAAYNLFPLNPWMF
jgi:hypothetical protein